MVLDRLDDEVLVEFPTCGDAIKAAQSLRSGFQEITKRLDLPAPELCGAIHCGEVTRWRSGLLAGDAVGIATTVKGAAGVGEIMLTGPAFATVQKGVEVEPLDAERAAGLPAVGDLWVLRL